MVPNRTMVRQLQRAAAALLCAATLVSFSANSATAGVDGADGWEADVRFLVSEINRLHPDPYFAVSREDFNSEVEFLIEDLSSSSDEEVLVGLMRLLALISSEGRDGHTTLFPQSIHLLPIQLYGFADGWHVVAARADHADLVGSRVTSIAGSPVEEVVTEVSEILTGDNDINRRDKCSMMILIPELLVGLGYLESVDAVEVTLEDSAGKERSVSLEGERGAARSRWMSVAGTKLPRNPKLRWLGNSQQSWWMESLEEEKALYVQYNAVLAQTDDESVAEFADRMVDRYDASGAERLILDVRMNNGGNNTTFGPLIRALQRPQINQPGRLYCLIGRATFSAAGNFVTVVERDTSAILVGEPSGGAPNQYGDARPIALPNHRDVLVLLSTRYHEFGGEHDHRLTHTPKLAVELSAADYFAGRDPVLQRALAHRVTR